MAKIFIVKRRNISGNAISSSIYNLIFAVKGSKKKFEIIVWRKVNDLLNFQSQALFVFIDLSINLVSEYLIGEKKTGILVG